MDRWGEHMHHRVNSLAFLYHFGSAREPFGTHVIISISGLGYPDIYKLRSVLDQLLCSICPASDRQRARCSLA